MTIVSQSSSIQKKISNLLRLLVQTFPLSLSLLFSLLSLRLGKNPVIQPHLTKCLPHLNNLITIPQILSQTSFLLPQLYYSSQFPSLETISLKLQKNFLHLVNFCLTFDPLFHSPITSSFKLISPLLDVNIVVNITLIAHEEQNGASSINFCNIVSNQSFLHGK